MKKLKTGLLINWNRLLRILMSVLGFSVAANLSSCEDGGGRAEYGTPSAKFIINGQVKSEQTTAAIPNIRVVMSGDSEFLADTSFTDANGKYSLDITNFPANQSFVVKFEDIDGTANGEYQSLLSTVEFIDPEYTNGSGNWYEGETSQTLNVNLKDKE